MSPYQIQNGLLPVGKKLRVKMPLETIHLSTNKSKKSDFGLSLSKYDRSSRALTWLVVLLIMGLGLYMRLGL